MQDDEVPKPPTRPPPIHWGEVTIIKPGDPRRGQFGEIITRFQQKSPDGQWQYDVKFSDSDHLVRYLHSELYMGRP